MHAGVEQSLDRERMLKTVLFAAIQRKRSKSHSGIPPVAGGR
jgi:hypothetical protein